MTLEVNGAGVGAKGSLELRRRATPSRPCSPECNDIPVRELECLRAKREERTVSTGVSS
jgi:hypothetical protein